MKRRPPGPQSIEEVVGSPSYDPLLFMSRMVQRYGDYSCYDSVLGPVYMINDPRAIQEVLRNPIYERKHLTSLLIGNGLLASHGPHWKRQRKLIQPYLTRDRVGNMVPTIVTLTERMLTTWRKKVELGELLCVSREFNSLTRDIILKAMFSLDLGADASVLTRAVDEIVLNSRVLLGTLFQDNPKFTPDGQAQTRQALSRMDEIIYPIIEERRQHPDQPPDLLGGLLSAVDAKTGKPLLTDKQIRDEILTMVVAGHETTAISLVWTSYFLTLHPDQQELVQPQIASVFGDNASITLMEVFSLQDIEWLIKEALRLYPPIWNYNRRVSVDSEIGGYPVKSGDLVVCGSYTVHRHREYWSEPERYLPQRFREPPGIAYLPFGFGRHICIGQHLALLEGVIILAKVLREFEFCSVEQETVTPQAIFTLRIKEGLRLRVKFRS